MIFIVKQTVHGSAGIELYKGDPKHHELLRMATTTPYLDHPAYPLKHAAGAFLQGESDQKKTSMDTR